MNLDTTAKITGGLSLMLIGNGALKYNMSKTSISVNESLCSRLNINLGLGVCVLTGALQVMSGGLSMYRGH